MLDVQTSALFHINSSSQGLAASQGIERIFSGEYNQKKKNAKDINIRSSPRKESTQLITLQQASSSTQRFQTASHF